MRILITGGRGFIARNLSVRLQELGKCEVVVISHDASQSDFSAACKDIDFVFHFAGVNRPLDPAEFELGNIGFTQRLVNELKAAKRQPPVLFSSSAQADRDNSYGMSKRGAEVALEQYSRETGAAVYIYRLPNVFGKWCQPNYNSAVATFCHNTARGIPIVVNDPSVKLNLVHIDDVVDAFLATAGLTMPANASQMQVDISPVYSATVGEIAQQIAAFKQTRESLVTESVGVGFVRALYATYVSYLPTNAFAYTVPKHEDPRGMFVEMLKTKDSGQFSFFTAHPGITRGGHYHHSKTEKFLVISGHARFKFRHVETNQRYELDTEGGNPTIVETIPGWAHDITNIGKTEMVVMLWANEIFDRNRPDTIASKV